MKTLRIENGLGTKIRDAVGFLIENGYHEALQLDGGFNVPGCWDDEVRWLADNHGEFTVGFAVNNLHQLMRDSPAGECRIIVEQWVGLFEQMVRLHSDAQ